MHVGVKRQNDAFEHSRETRRLLTCRQKRVAEVVSTIGQ